MVKTLNTLNAGLMVNPGGLAGGDHTIFVSGNDAAAKAEVSRLLAEWFGWSDVVDLGDITTVVRHRVAAAGLGSPDDGVRPRELSIQDREVGARMGEPDGLALRRARRLRHRLCGRPYPTTPQWRPFPGRPADPLVRALCRARPGEGGLSRRAEHGD